MLQQGSDKVTKRYLTRKTRVGQKYKILATVADWLQQFDRSSRRSLYFETEGEAIRAGRIAEEELAENQSVTIKEAMEKYEMYERDEKHDKFESARDTGYHYWSKKCGSAQFPSPGRQWDSADSREIQELLRTVPREGPWRRAVQQPLSFQHVAGF